MSSFQPQSTQNRDIESKKKKVARNIYINRWVNLHFVILHCRQTKKKGENDSNVFYVVVFRSEKNEHSIE